MPCNSFSFQLTFWATSRWTPNATSLPSNTTWLSLFRSFWLKSPTFLPRHVLLDLQRDIATFQYDVAHVFSPFCLRILASLPCHVLLDLQRDIATSQYDVAHAFSPFLTQNTRFLAEPRRIGLPTRHGCLPTRRGAPFYTKKPPALYGWLPTFFILTQKSNLV